MSLLKITSGFEPDFVLVQCLYLSILFKFFLLFRWLEVIESAAQKQCTFVNED